MGLIEICSHNSYWRGLDYFENKRVKSLKQLQFNGREILDNPGKVSREVAEKFALSEFEKFRIIQEQRLISDYDLFISDTKFEEIPEISKKK